MNDKTLYNVCEHCGNRERFLLNKNLTQYVDTTILINGTGDYLEELEKDIYDEEINQEKSLICQKCEEEIFEGTDLCKEELVKLLYEHTCKDGTWSKEELPENERNPDILEKHFLELITE